MAVVHGALIALHWSAVTGGRGPGSSQPVLVTTAAQALYLPHPNLLSDVQCYKYLPVKSIYHSNNNGIYLVVHIELYGMTIHTISQRIWLSPLIAGCMWPAMQMAIACKPQIWGRPCYIPAITQAFTHWHIKQPQPSIIYTQSIIDRSVIIEPHGSC